MCKGVGMERGVGRGVLRMEGGVLRRERVKMVWGVGRKEGVRIHDGVGKG